jgi:competence ComEA-like helix-hairpin-helix protein
MKNQKITLSLLGLVLLVAWCWGQDKSDIPPNPADRFPEAEGKEEVTTTCSACHTLVRVMTNRRTAKAWGATVKIHQQQRGLKLETDEIPTIVNYLGAWFGPMVNINTATADDLADLPQVGKKVGEAIVAYREKKGPFKSIDDLTLVEGFPPDLLPKLKQRLETGAKEK